MLQPATLDELQQAVREHERLLPRGGASKPALAAESAGMDTLDLTRLAGILEYTPGEFTFTALAGTRLADIEAALAEHGQYLPFDPPFVRQGATLGGTVAAGLNGPGRFRYGGIRDFILGVRLVDGQGRLVRGGGKVVKNAAGFDIPKLMVGSLGMFGALAELTFKVFPRQPACATLSLTIDGLDRALGRLTGLINSQLDVDAVELEPVSGGATIWVRLRGLPGALPARMDRVRAILGGGQATDGDLIPNWPFGGEGAAGGLTGSLVKIPVAPARIPELETTLASGSSGSRRRYSSGGNVLWLVADRLPETLNDALTALNLSGLVVAGAREQVRLGIRRGQTFEHRIKQVFDPSGRFPNY